MTFSLIVRDPKTRLFGVGVASASPNAGSACPRIIPGKGAMSILGLHDERSSQIESQISMWLGLEAGAEKALERGLMGDARSSGRQIGLIDKLGETAAFSGMACQQYAGDKRQMGTVILGDFLSGPEVLDEIAKAYSAASGSMQDRILLALEAGEAAGVDRRGIRSAGIMVQSEEDRSVHRFSVANSRSAIEDLRVKLSES